jgi:hypothetical protein
MAPRPNKHHQPAVTRIVINGGQFVDRVAASRCKPKEHVALVIVNNDATDYQVRMTNFKNNVTLPATPVLESDLFVVAAASHQVGMNDVTLVKRKVKPAGNWGTGGGQFPYTSYEFTLELWNSGGTAKLDDIDPDFDITPI